jgi:hypothetical protein
MSPASPSDVKRPLRPPFLTQTHLDQPESLPDATGFSGAVPDSIEANPSGIAEYFVAEHSSFGTTFAPESSQGNSLIGSVGSETPATSKGAQS